MASSTTFLTRLTTSLSPSFPTSNTSSPSLSASSSLSPPISSALLRPTNPTSSFLRAPPSPSPSPNPLLISAASFPTTLETSQKSTFSSQSYRLLHRPPTGPECFLFSRAPSHRIPKLRQSIGSTFNHVAADGMAFNHFMKSWACISRTTPNGQDLTFLDESAESVPPCHDRDAIADPYGLEPILLKIWRETMALTFEEKVGRGLQDMVRDTFVLGRAHILKLKSWVLAQCVDEEEASALHASTFVVTCAFIWVHLIRSKSQQQTQAESELMNEMDHLCFAADCRNRKGMEYPIAVTYFGNCLAICFVSVKRSELVGENGIFAAAKAIGKRVKELESGALRGAEKWMSGWKEASETGNLLTVAGSPKLGVYKTDFGWGRPRKSQVVHTDVVSAISLADSKDEQGGIEIGMSLHKDQMHIFNACSQQSLNLL